MPGSGPARSHRRRDQRPSSGGRLIAPPLSISLEPSFLVVYPQDFELPGELTTALDDAGIAHRAGTFPYGSADDQASVAYLVEAERLAGLGNRETVAHALELIERTQGATTIVLADPGDRAHLWLAEDPHVGGWLVRPLDPVAVVATITAARALRK